MSAQIPFTAYFETTPSRGKSKWVYIRDLQRLSNALYEALEDVTSIAIASPGSGQNQLSGQFDSITNGTCARPQIGNNPSLLMIEGFYTASSVSVQPAPAKTIICNNQFMSGPSGPRLYGDNTNYPSSVVNSEVATLCDILNTAASSITDDSSDSPILFRLMYKNIIWGDSGLTFPQN